MQSLFDHIPVGVGSKGIIPMGARDLEEALEMGMDWSLREGYAWAEDKVNNIGNGIEQPSHQISCVNFTARRTTCIAISILRNTVRSMDVCYKLTRLRFHHVLRREAYLKLVYSVHCYTLTFTFTLYMCLL